MKEATGKRVPKNSNEWSEEQRQREVKTLEVG